ncbi:ABC transporter substrate-binding protein [Paracoccus luteus]|uniref:ABC transporter substrate-binding protein n=1 Tax=Paracoccus luteus TaxID=2508543 RepID=UPI001FE52A23|nr:ABC transporter substrate-binding protein [Paracoccus luteus]
MSRIVKRAAAIAIAAATAAQAQAEDIKVGLLLPFSGVYAALGEEIEAGFRLGLDSFGADSGATFEILREDSEASPPVGLAKTRKLIMQDRVDVMAGVVSSGVLAAIRDVVDGAKVPLIVANAGNDEATGKACSPYITRISFSNAQLNRPMGKYLVDHGVTKVVTFAPDYAAGQQMMKAFGDAFVAAGGEIVAQEFTPFQKTQDFGPYLAKAKTSGAQAVYAFYAGSEAIAFVKQYDSFGMKEALPLYGPGFLNSQLYVGAQGAAAQGIVTALHYVPTIDNAANKAFVAAFTAQAGHLPSEYAVQGYDAARALVEAVKSGATDRESLAAALPRTSFDGPRGKTAIDPATNNIMQPIYVYDTVAGPDGPTQKVLAQLPVEVDPVNGCEMATLN